jgi:hypothetical protein
VPSVLDALSEGMHTMAQPLTVLRATLEIAAGNASSVSQFQHAIDSSLVEISRVSEAMGFVRELVRIARDVSELVPVELGAAVAMAHEDLKVVFETAGIGLEIYVPDDLPRVVASESRLRQCLFYVLQQAVRVCRAGGAIDLAAGEIGEEVHLVVRKVSSEPVPEDPLANQRCFWGNVAPYLALAEALARAQGGRLEWQIEPLAVCLSLPVDDEARYLRSGRFGQR